MRWPWVSRYRLEEAEKQIDYRDKAIEQMRRERDAAQQQAQRATDELIMRLGCAPITPVVVAQNAERDKEAAEVAKQYGELVASIDAENRMIDEELAN